MSLVFPPRRAPSFSKLPPFSYHILWISAPLQFVNHIYPSRQTSSLPPHTSTFACLRGAQRGAACGQSTSRGAHERGGTYRRGWGTSPSTTACRSWRSIRPACTKNSRYWNSIGRVGGMDAQAHDRDAKYILWEGARGGEPVVTS